MNIALKGRRGTFSIKPSDTGFHVDASDEDDSEIAELATRHANNMTKMYYTPDLGEAYAFFSKVAAAYLNAEIVGEIPSGTGELEKAFVD